MSEHLKITAKLPRKRYIADGAQLAFIFDFVIFTPSDVCVRIDGIVAASGYTVQIQPSGTGSVNFSVPPTAGTIIVITRALSIKRESDFQEGGDLRAKTLNDELDFQTAALQQVEAVALRALRVPDEDADTVITALPDAGTRATKLLAFDASGNPTISSLSLAQMEVGSVTASTSATIAVDSASAAAASAASASTSATTAVNAANAAVASIGQPADSSVTNVKIAANAVTLNKLAREGTAGQVLVSGGAGANPSYQDVVATNVAIIAGENLADRDLIYEDIFNQRGAGADRWYKIDTDAVGPVRISPRVGIALAAIASAATGSAQIRPGRVSGFTALTVGQPVYASATAGAITQTAPALPSTGTQNATRLIGIAASATDIDFLPEDDTLFARAAKVLAAGSSVTIEHWPDAGAPDRVPFASTLGGIYVTTAENTAVSIGTGGWFSHNTRTRISAGQILTSGSKVRITLKAASVGVSFTDCFIGEAASGGNGYNFQTAPVRVTFAGANGGTIAGGGTLLSDEITLTLDETRDFLVSTLLSATGGGTPFATENGTVTGWNGWYKTGSNAADAAAQAPTGTYNSAYAPCVSKIEVVGAGRREPEPLFPESRFVGAADKITCRYDDGTGANADTRTTFINRTGATRDLAVEVVL